MAVYYEKSDAKWCNGHNVRRGGIRRGKTTVTAFCVLDDIHDYLTKPELQSVAKSFLDGKDRVIEIDFRS